jgi:hypothetical protein
MHIAEETKFGLDQEELNNSLASMNFHRNGKQIKGLMEWQLLRIIKPSKKNLRN